MLAGCSKLTDSAPLVLLAQTPYFRYFMNGDCNRGRFLLVVPQCYGGDNHAIRNHSGLASSVMKEAHLAKICFFGNAFHHQTHRVLAAAEWLTRAPRDQASAVAFVRLALGKPSVNCERQQHSSCT